jgi:hypothetical protein
VSRKIIRADADYDVLIAGAEENGSAFITKFSVEGRSTLWLDPKEKTALISALQGEE